MQTSRIALRIALFLLAALGGAVCLAAPEIDMVLLAEQNLSTATSGRKWVEVLSRLGVGDVQIRAAQSGEKPGIESRGTPTAPRYRVTCKLVENHLVVPGGKFGLGDREALAKWLKDLGDNGPAGATERKGAFGLLAKQLTAVRDDLAQPVKFKTKGMSAAQAVEKIRGQLKFKLTVGAAAEKAIAADDPVRDELDGIACGTALAAIARPAGAILQPQKPGGDALQYALTKAAQGSESWPIGWPPVQNQVKVLPQLLDTLAVEIRGIPAHSAIDAIQARMKVPFLYDHNAIVKNRIDMAKRVTIPRAKKAYYATVLREVLFQAGLKYSLRVRRGRQAVDLDHDAALIHGSASFSVFGT